MAAAGIATLAIASLIVLALGPSWRDRRGLSEGAQTQPETDRSLGAWSSQEDDPSSVEGPAAEFRAELYGIAEPLVERLPNSVDARCLLASVHKRFARRAEAACELRRCIALDPACAEAHYSLGLLAIGVSDYPMAEKHFRDVLDIDPHWADASLRLARAQMSRDNSRAAVLTLQTYLHMEPRSAQAWCQLGKAHQQLGDFSNAKRSHLKSIDVDPDSAEAHYGLARALQELDAADEARVYFEKFRRIQCSSTTSVRSDKAAWTDEGRVRTATVKTLAEAGMVYAMHGYLADAEKCWTRATTLNPNHAESLEMLCHLRPDNPEHWLKLGRLYIQGNRPAEAEGPFQRVIELAPQQADGHAALAEVYIRLGRDTEEAARLARTAVKLEPTAPNHFVLAAACERLENRTDAESALEHAVKLNPANPQYREALAKLQEGRRP